MKKLLLVFALAASLGGCANLTNAWQTLTGATVSPTAVYVAANSFDAVEVTATNYLRLCHSSMSNPGCSKSAIAAVIPAVRSGRIARNNLEQFLRAHPNAVGASGLYDALVTSTNTLQSVIATYNIGVAK